MAFKIEMDLLGRCFITIVKDSAIFFLCIREPGSIAVGHPKKIFYLTTTKELAYEHPL
jgi:hypothetical protein